MADKMYFISRGTVSLNSTKHRIEDTISDGGYFGERALLQVLPTHGDSFYCIML